MTTHRATLTHAVTAADHSQGPESAPVTLIEYGDFECPHCGHAYPVVEEVVRHFGNRLRFVYRHFPLSEIHPHAEMAAEAAEAAGAQDRFWEMHAALFEHQDALDTAHLHRYAAQLGLDAQQFGQQLSDRSFQLHVRQDFMSGVRSGVNGTPTFFINGVRYDGMPDVRGLEAAIEDAASREHSPSRHA